MLRRFIKRIENKLPPSLQKDIPIPLFLEKRKDDIKAALEHIILFIFVGYIVSLFSVESMLSEIIPIFEVIESNNISNLAFKGLLTFIILYLIHRTRGRYKRTMILEGKEAITEGAFLTYYKLNSINAEILEAENELREKAEHAESIRILGASGLKTYGSDSSPLFNSIQNCSELFVMMLHPKGEGINIRARSLFPKLDRDGLNKKINEYTDEIKQSIATLKQINNSKKSVRLGFYNEEPLLKIIIINHQLIWLQHYEGGTHVRDLPTYFMEKDESQPGTGLFKAMLDIFDRKWEHVEKNLYNFSTDEIYNYQTEEYEPFS